MMAQQTVFRKIHAYRLEPFDARKHIGAVAVCDARQLLFHERGRERAAVRLEHDFTRTTFAERKIAVVLSILRAELVYVRVFEEFVLAEYLQHVGEENAGAFIRTGMELRRAVDERSSGKRGASVVERDRRAFAGHRIHLAGQVHVKRLRERRGILVREFRTRQKRTELRVDLRDPSGSTVGLGLDVRQKLL